jgi:hypothetical protein
MSLNNISIDPKLIDPEILKKLNQLIDPEILKQLNSHNLFQNFNNILHSFPDDLQTQLIEYLRYLKELTEKQANRADLFMSTNPILRIIAYGAQIAEQISTLIKSILMSGLLFAFSSGSFLLIKNIIDNFIKKKHLEIRNNSSINNLLKNLKDQNKIHTIKLYEKDGIYKDETESLTVRYSRFLQTDQIIIPNCKKLENDLNTRNKNKTTDSDQSNIKSDNESRVMFFSGEAGLGKTFAANALDGIVLEFNLKEIFLKNIHRHKEKESFVSNFFPGIASKLLSAFNTNEDIKTIDPVFNINEIQKLINQNIDEFNECLNQIIDKIVASKIDKDNKKKHKIIIALDEFDKLFNCKESKFISYQNFFMNFLNRCLANKRNDCEIVWTFMSNKKMVEIDELRKILEDASNNNNLNDKIALIQPLYRRLGNEYFFEATHLDQSFFSHILEGNSFTGKNSYTDIQKKYIFFPDDCKNNNISQIDMHLSFSETYEDTDKKNRIENLKNQLANIKIPDNVKNILTALTESMDSKIALLKTEIDPIIDRSNDNISSNRQIIFNADDNIKTRFANIDNNKYEQYQYLIYRMIQIYNMDLFNKKISNFQNYKDLKEFVDNLHDPKLKKDEIYKKKSYNKSIKIFFAFEIGENRECIEDKTFLIKFLGLNENQIMKCESSTQLEDLIEKRFSEIKPSESCKYIEYVHGLEDYDTKHKTDKEIIENTKFLQFLDKDNSLSIPDGLNLFYQSTDSSRNNNAQSLTDALNHLVKTSSPDKSITLNNAQNSQRKISHKFNFNYLLKYK